MVDCLNVQSILALGIPNNVNTMGSEWAREAFKRKTFGFECLCVSKTGLAHHLRGPPSHLRIDHSQTAIATSRRIRVREAMERGKPEVASVVNALSRCEDQTALRVIV